MSLSNSGIQALATNGYNKPLKVHPCRKNQSLKPCFLFACVKNI